MNLYLERESLQPEAKDQSTRCLGICCKINGTPCHATVGPPPIELHVAAITGPGPLVAAILDPRDHLWLLLHVLPQVVLP